MTGLPGAAARSRTCAMLMRSRAVHDIPQWKNSCPESHRDGDGDDADITDGKITIFELENSILNGEEG